MSDVPTIRMPGEEPPNATVVQPARPIGADSSAATLHEPTRPTSFNAAIGQRFGDYELLSEIARGGMGVVYRARQMTLDRVVALKMILAGRLANEDEVARFRTEAEAAARLQHPNIVKVYDCEEREGQHFFTMEFIEGTSLDQKLAHGPLPCRSAARYVRILARAVGYAHKHGILHRDLKPSNILIDANDEPHITDFGLAKRLGNANSGHTRTGAVLGTPSYMSPEQAQGKANELGPAADVYSLGAILYELMSGRPPFRAATPLDTVMQVIDHQPVPPRLLNPKIDHDLETICLKCLEKDPANRYASAEELGDDLQRYIDGDSISARSFNMIDRLAHVLERDSQTGVFATWGTMLQVMAAGIFLEHFAVFVLVLVEASRVYVNLARALLFVFLGVLFWRNRRNDLLPRSAAEREMWTFWIGYIAAYFAIVIIVRLLVDQETLASNESVVHGYLLELLPYPFLAIIAGLTFFIMGANYWGRCYAVGVTFFIAAPLMTMDLRFAPLIFGAIWGVTLMMVGRHLRPPEPAHAPMRTLSPNSQAATVAFKEAPP